MADKTSTYRPPHCEDIATTMTPAEFDALLNRLINAGGKQPPCEQQHLPAGLADTQPDNKKAPQFSPRGDG